MRKCHTQNLPIRLEVKRRFLKHKRIQETLALLCANDRQSLIWYRKDLEEIINIWFLHLLHISTVSVFSLFLLCYCFFWLSICHSTAYFCINFGYRTFKGIYNYERPKMKSLTDKCVLKSRKMRTLSSFSVLFKPHLL